MIKKILNLKLENIMVYNNHIKIIDFGESIMYKINGKEIFYKGIHGTDSYMPPEMINEEGNGITQEFITYVNPLIQGENTPQFSDGVQQFSIMKQK